MSAYTLVTEWHLDAPIGRVWQALFEVDAWPTWWPYVRAVQLIEAGDASGVGAVRRYTWGSRLPYTLSFDMRTTIVQAPHWLEGEASGELAGNGRWTLTDQVSTTRVRYDWTVTTTRAWMNALAPMLAPVFRWNHGQVMAAGGQGLAKHLGAQLLGSGQ
jgi:uncharacterized protein YndB with AHSA1/START domain